MAAPVAVRTRPPSLAAARVRPTSGATGVRPDVRLEFDLRPQLSGPGGRAIRRRLATRAFSVLIADETGAQRVLAGRDPAVTVDGAGLVTVRPPEPLPRYTWHVTILRLLPDDSEDEDQWAEVAGNEAEERPGADSPWLLKTVFRTGSDLHEPTQVRVSQAPIEAVAGRDVTYRLTVLDDYGLPAWGAEFSALAAESGTRLPGSAVVRPGPAAPGRLGPDKQGQVVVLCADPEAEAVQATVKISHPKYGFAAERRWEVRFLPAAPRDLVLSAPNLKAAAGDRLEVRGRVADEFGNGIPAQAVSVEAWGSAFGAWRAIGRPAQTGDDGRFSFSLTSPAPQYVQIRASLAAGPAATLGEALRFEPGPDPTTGRGTAESTLTRALAADVPGDLDFPGLPLLVTPPTAVTAAPGAFAPGATVVVSLVDNLGSWDPWSGPLPSTATTRAIGRGTAAADGSLALATEITFAPGDLVSVEVAPVVVAPDPPPPPPPPPPSPQPLQELSGRAANGRAYVAQVLPPGSYSVRLQEDSPSGPERFAVFYYRLIPHNGWTEGVLMSLLETGQVSEVNGSTCAFTLNETQTVSFMIEAPGPTFNYTIQIFTAP